MPGAAHEKSRSRLIVTVIGRRLTVATLVCHPPIQSSAAERGVHSGSGRRRRRAFGWRCGIFGVTLEATREDGLSFCFLGTYTNIVLVFSFDPPLACGAQTGHHISSHMHDRVTCMQVRCAGFLLEARNWRHPWQRLPHGYSSDL
jgi:hypothetical protein